MRPELLSPLEYLPHPRGLFYALTSTRVFRMNQLFCLPYRCFWTISALLSGPFLLATLDTAAAETPPNMVSLIRHEPHQATDPASFQPQGVKPRRGLLDDWWAPTGMR